MALELNYYELFQKKINDFAFLINLKMNTDLNDFSYQESFSKFFLIKNVIDKMLDKITDINNTSMNNSYTSGYQDTHSKVSESRRSSLNTDNGLLSELKILDMNHIDQFFNYDSGNKVIQHIKDLLERSYEKISHNLESLGLNHKGESDKIPSKLYQNHENIMQWDLFIGKLLYEKDKKIEQLSRNIKDFKSDLNILNKNIKTAEDKADSNQIMTNEENQKIKSLLHMVEESKQIL